MASVINGVRRRRAGLDNPLTSVQGQLVYPVAGDRELRGGQLGLADLGVVVVGEVLDVLGIR